MFNNNIMFIGKFEDDKNSVIVMEGDVIGFFFFVL